MVEMEKACLAGMESRSVAIENTKSRALEKVLCTCQSVGQTFCDYGWMC